EEEEQAKKKQSVDSNKDVALEEMINATAEDEDEEHSPIFEGSPFYDLLKMKRDVQDNDKIKRLASLFNIKDRSLEIGGTNCIVTAEDFMDIMGIKDGDEEVEMAPKHTEKPPTELKQQAKKKQSVDSNKDVAWEEMINATAEDEEHSPVFKQPQNIQKTKQKSEIECMGNPWNAFQKAQMRKKKLSSKQCAPRRKKLNMGLKKKRKLKLSFAEDFTDIMCIKDGDEEVEMAPKHTEKPPTEIKRIFSNSKKVKFDKDNKNVIELLTRSVDEDTVKRAYALYALRDIICALAKGCLNGWYLDYVLEIGTLKKKQ
nr:hypothetical protein [Tanacetum cinerariifolium]